ncbi:MAG: sigma-70 family RNA polymerase sigma factor [Oscillospiraceae bacterium]|jgi:RNA polymerase sigma-70 factor (ECF subfamily)|nr:sigma-70 family RNA polymerase sigma factor [Oscillospiraceae bacterium]
MDKNVYAKRVEQMKPRLYRIVYLYFSSEAMALDAVYEAVYRGLVSVSKLREHAYFETWITRIVINECKKILRRAKREQSLDTVPEMSEEYFDSLSLKEAIQKLPQELREVVILRYFSGFTVVDIAKSLNIPQGTVATRQRRALQLLKLELTDEE